MRTAFFASLTIVSSKGFGTLLQSSTNFFRSNRTFGKIPSSSIVASMTTTSASSTSSSEGGSGVPLAAAVAKEERPYGAWESPITSKAITAGSVGISNIKLDSKGNLYWLEGRPQEGGRIALCQYAPENKSSSARHGIDMTPQDSNVRTRVHEYGGGAITFGTTTRATSTGTEEDEDVFFYSDFKSQRVMKLVSDNNNNDNESVPITPNVENAQYRFADGVYDSTNDQLYMIREDHIDKPLSKDVVNEIVAVPASPPPSTKDGDEVEYNVQVVATGNDFYAAPRLSPDGTKLAYITWNHPNMPWDATELRVRSVVNQDDTESSTATHKLIAGSDGDTSIIQPLWHPITGDLYYISDESGFYNIYRHKSDSNDENSSGVSSVLPLPYDFGGSAPGWSLGQQGFTFLSDGRLVAHYKKGGKSRLIVANVLNDGDDGPVATDIEEYGTENGLPMQFGSVIGGTSRKGEEESQDLYFIGGSPSTPTSIYKWNLQTQGDAIQLACSSTLQFEDTMISIPKSIEFPTSNEKTAFGYYYEPTNGNFQSANDGTNTKPPLLVKAHGGPTACTGTSFNAGIQYWTSRGFAVLDVDYGGSTGYGRDYRRRLRQSWGVVDIDDVCAGATYLVEQGLVDGERLCIDGGSAGGYTTLGALAFRPHVFKAGCSLYGIGDLTALAGDTHKFESRYLDGLVGAYPEEEELYKQRSPIESVDTLNCPILLLQGAEDKVVPPNQAEMMHKALLDKKIPTCLKIYDNEQHGFRNAENIEDAIDSELAFYGRVFDINVPGALDLHIDNLP